MTTFMNYSNKMKRTKKFIQIRDVLSASYLTLIITYLLMIGWIDVRAQLSPSEAGYVDAVADHGAINDGLTVTTQQLQSAIKAAISQGKPLYLPPGEYLIDKTLIANDTRELTPDEEKVVIQGYSVDSQKRSTIILKDGTFPDINNPGVMIRSEDSHGYPDIFNRILQHVDFKIQGNNAGAVAVDWRGAEGCGLFDIHIDVTGGRGGFVQMPGSGGSAVNISVKGGIYGVDMRTSNGGGAGTQPTPTITDAAFVGQTEAAIYTFSNRGSVTLTACTFQLSPGVSAVRNRSRMTAWPFTYGGNIVMTDCIIEYSQSNANNTAIFFERDDANRAQSIYASNVYLKNAAYFVNQIHTVAANPSGWKHFKEVAFSSGKRTYNNGSQQETIYIDGIKQGDLYIDAGANTPPPANLASQHSWGKTFPSFNSPGAVNLKNYSPVNGDWAPALQNAINAAASSPSGVVFVPPGEYDMYGGVTMADNTKIIGVSHHHSSLNGQDDPDRRFGGSTDPYQPIAIITSSANKSANNILADIRVRPLRSVLDRNHDPTPSPRISILWRAGTKSIIRNISYRARSQGQNFRPSFVLTNTLNRDEWLTLRSIPSPSTINGFRFYSDCAVQYFNQARTDTRILAETVNNSRRLLTRSIPFNNKGTNAEKPNLEIAKANGESFSLESLEVFNGAWNPRGGGDILIEVHTKDCLSRIKVPITGLNRPREEVQTVNLNLPEVTKVVITSTHQFSVDNIKVDGTTIDFENVTGDRLESPRDFTWSIYYDSFRDLPLSYQTHEMVKITGGVRWYNHWIHGDVWMNPEKPYVLVENNDEPVFFYHFHAQHPMNDAKLLINNGSDVSVLGTKVEQSGHVAKAVNSNNIRFLGHGGLTTAIPGSALYWVENCTNVTVASPTDELDAQDFCQFCGSGSAILPQAKYGSYSVIADVAGTEIRRSDPFERPILWKGGKFIPVFTITAIACANGQITDVGDLLVNGGGAQSYTIEPDPGYEVEDVKIDGQSVGAVTSYAFNGINGDHSIQVTFKELNIIPTEYIITASAGANGSISPLGQITVQEGGSQSFKITPEADHEIAEVLVDDTSVGAISSYEFTNIQSSHSISVSFRALPPKIYTITAVAGANGSISPSGDILVTEGASQIFNMQPDADYQIEEVWIDGTSVGAVNSFTFTDVRTNHHIEVSFIQNGTEPDTSQTALKIFNQFTPNGDGINDTWQIDGLDQYVDYRIRVFTKNGQLVFQSRDYQTPWDGSHQGRPLTAGIYYYSIRLEQEKQAQSGYVVLIR